MPVDEVDEPDWKARFAKSVADQVRRLRLERGLSVQKVADICSETYGVPMKRSVLANFEGGRRPALSVVELIVIARILGVPPVQLLFPVGRQEKTELFPGDAVDTWEALRWFTGEQPWVPQPEGSNLTELQMAKDVDLFRRHDKARLAVEDARRTIMTFIPMEPLGGEGEPTPPIPPALMEQLTGAMGRAENDLLAVRREMRAQELEPPSLPYDLAYLKEVE